MKILVTGGTGFVGRAVCSRLVCDGQAGISRTVRSAAEAIPGVADIRIGDIGPGTDWSGRLTGIDAVVHTAARVHAFRERADDEYRRVNAEGTVHLARQAVAAGVRRFVFISTIKVNGECTRNGHAFSADDPPAPADAYSRSKHAAETALRDIARTDGMEVVVIRPPLVYGPGVQANFLKLMEWIHRGSPIPFRRVRNKRSLVALENLVDLVAACVSHPAAANETLTVCDGEDVSTGELVVRIGAAMRRPIRLVPVPVWLLRGCARLVGKAREADRLLGSLQVDMSKTCRLLGWKPAVSMEAALEQAVQHFLATVHR
jgi:UDP-glucose 4-epimerase